MKIPYYPGCTLNTKAKGCDRAVRDSFAALGVELSELKQWNCCGATFPLSDNLLDLAGPSRILVSARSEGESLVVTCATCYNVLKRTNRLLSTDQDKRERINHFIESDYSGDLKVRHLLEILRDTVGWEKVTAAVRKPLTALKIAAYYGCMLLRPPGEMQFDDPENPQVLDNLVRALGGQPVDYPHRGECCGSYLAAFDLDVTKEMAFVILASARRAGAELIVTSCPLCQFNLDRWQQDLALKHGGFLPLPILYDGQLLALALGLDPAPYELERHTVDPRPVLARAGM